MKKWNKRVGRNIIGITQLPDAKYLAYWYDATCGKENILNNGKEESFENLEDALSFLGWIPSLFGIPLEFSEGGVK